jgi:hypothetical protein
MELSDIDARIAQLKEQIALKEATQNKVKEAYHNPYSKYHYGYIYDAIMGDRSGLDREAAEEAAYQKLLMEQAQADKIRAEQAYNTAYENELNRINAQELAKHNKSQQSEYNLSKARETLGNLAITRDTLAGQGKDTRMVDNQIQSLVERYPELQMPESPKYDATKSVDYKLAKYSPINSKSTNSEVIADAMEELKKFNTPEAAKRLAELELEYDKRVKYEESDAYIKDLIKAFDVNTGDLDPALANRGYESKHATGGKFKLVKDGKVIKSYSGKKSQSWD